MTSQANRQPSYRKVREIRPGASKEPIVSNPGPMQKLLQSGLKKVGDFVTLGNKWNLRPYQLRRIGAVAVLASAAIATPLAREAGEHVVWGAQYEMSSEIPTSETNINPKVDVLVAIPPSGAYDLASERDPNNNPQHGVYNFTQQLHGKTPEPGDIVAVPRIEPPK